MSDTCYHQDVDWIDIWLYERAGHDKVVGHCNECEGTVCVRLVSPIGLVDEDGEYVDLDDYFESNHS